MVAKEYKGDLVLTRVTHLLALLMQQNVVTKNNVMKQGLPMLTVVAGVIEHEHRILIAQRKPEDRLAHLWEFPGGKLEPGETPEQALVRELREEFEISTEVLDYLGVNIHAYEHITVELLAYCVRYTGGEFALHDHQAIRWVTYTELDDYEFAPADIPLVRLVQERKRCEQTL